MKVIVEVNGERHELIECLVATCPTCSLRRHCLSECVLCQSFKSGFRFSSNVMFVLENYGDNIETYPSEFDYLYNYQDILEVIKNKFI